MMRELTFNLVESDVVLGQTSKAGIGLSLVFIKLENLAKGIVATEKDLDPGLQILK